MSRFEDKLRARPEHEILKGLNAGLVPITTEERDALADAVEALRVLQNPEWYGEETDRQARVKSMAALARLDATSGKAPD